ncbi:hypothetical protein G7L32_26885, partial [Klebsiella quasipneumoniae]|nr:hypothetical protein [Klebsiella quasipneumoniae]
EMGVATLVCGPGSMAQGHKADEYHQHRPDRTLHGDAGPALREMGVATLVCGPGSMAQGHKADEYHQHRPDRTL